MASIHQHHQATEKIRVFGKEEPMKMIAYEQLTKAVTTMQKELVLLCKILAALKDNRTAQLDLPNQQVQMQKELFTLRNAQNIFCKQMVHTFATTAMEDRVWKTASVTIGFFDGQIPRKVIAYEGLQNVIMAMTKDFNVVNRQILNAFSREQHQTLPELRAKRAQLEDEISIISSAGNILHPLLLKHSD
jgi:hypothetical protein